LEELLDDDDFDARLEEEVETDCLLRVLQGYRPLDSHLATCGYHLMCVDAVAVAAAFLSFVVHVSLDHDSLDYPNVEHDGWSNLPLPYADVGHYDHVGRYDVVVVAVAAVACPRHHPFYSANLL
jgi:hypothetical protein